VAWWAWVPADGNRARSGQLDVSNPDSVSACLRLSPPVSACLRLSPPVSACANESARQRGPQPPVSADHEARWGVPTLAASLPARQTGRPSGPRQPERTGGSWAS